MGNISDDDIAMGNISDDDEGGTHTACMHMCVRALTFGCHRIRSLDLGLDRPTWYVVLCYAMLCYDMVWHVLCYATLCYAMVGCDADPCTYYHACKTM